VADLHISILSALLKLGLNMKRNYCTATVASQRVMAFVHYNTVPICYCESTSA
jgi:hypothetical protein